MLSQRKRVVRSQHDVFRFHRIHKKFERTLIKDGRVHIKATQIIARRQFTVAMRNRVMLPRILQSAKQERKTSAPVRETDAQCLRQPVKGAAQNHGHDAQLRFGGHAHRPRHHVIRHARLAQHVPRMHQNRHAFVRAVMQERHQPGIIQIFIANMIADLHAQMSTLLAARKFLAGHIDVLQRHLAQRFQSALSLRAQFKSRIVELPRAIQRMLRRTLIRKQYRGSGDHLHIYAIAIHILQSSLGIPTG